MSQVNEALYNSGLTSDVLVTVPSMAINEPILSVRISRIPINCWQIEKKFEILFH